MAFEAGSDTTILSDYLTEASWPKSCASVVARSRYGAGEAGGRP